MLIILLFSLLGTVLAFSNVVLPVVTAGENPTISAAWYTSWHAVDFPLSRVSWSKYTHLIYAFALTTPDVTTLGLDNSDFTLLPQFVSYAKQHNVIPMLSIAGYTGSRWFSSYVGSPRNRTAFVKTVTDLVQRYNLNGLDFDWEFPGTAGVGCNVRGPNDTVNFLAFLQELRKTTVGRNLVLSAATETTPWVDATGQPSKDVSAFAQVLDFISVMNYDIRSNPSLGRGPSAPLDDSCAPQGARFGSAKSAVAAWTSAGMPAKKIVLGVPSYAHAVVLSGQNSASTTTVPAYPPYLNQTRRGDRWDGEGGLDVCGKRVGPGGTYEYWGLMEAGFLNQDGSPRDGIRYRFDDCSKTPFLYNPTAQLYVSYENALSFAHKGGFIHSAGLRGFVLWEAGGDYNDALLDSILNATRNGGPDSGLASGSPNPGPTSGSPATHVDSSPQSGAPVSWPSILRSLPLSIFIWLAL